MNSIGIDGTDRDESQDDRVKENKKKQRNEGGKRPAVCKQRVYRMKVRQERYVHVLSTGRCKQVQVVVRL